MDFLYKAYACEQIDQGSKALLPGCEAKPNMRRLTAGDKIQVELADGTRLQTEVVKTRILTLADSAATKFHAKNGFYCAVEVPTTFDAPGIALGANVHLL